MILSGVMVSVVFSACSFLPRDSNPNHLVKLVTGAGVDVDLRTVDGNVVPADRFKMASARDLAQLRPGEPSYTIHPAGLPPFEKIQRIDFKGRTLGRSWVGSHPDQIQFYRLGNTRHTVPPPPDWFRQIDHSPAWNPATSLEDAAVQPFLNHSISCWVDPEQHPRGEGSIYLFRQAFELKGFDQIARATLRIATNSEFREGWLNERPIHAGQGLDAGIIELEVTGLLRDGTNILALQLGERPVPVNRRYGLLYHIEITTHRSGRASPRSRVPTALLTTDSGDRVWGHVRAIRGSQLEMDTAYGFYSIPWEQCTGLIFPGGWNSSIPEKSGHQWFRSGRESTIAKVNPCAIPVNTMPPSLEDSILLTDMRRITAKPTYVAHSKLHVEDNQGNQYTVPTHEIMAIYPPRTIKPRVRRPQQPAAVLYCRLKTIFGEELSGWLLELNGGRVMIESSGHGQLLIKPEWISDIYFPYHATPISQERSGASSTLGILEQIEGQESYQPLYEQDSRAVRGAAFSMGMTNRTVPAESLVHNTSTPSDTYPVLMYIDPIGEYMHTRDEEGDVKDALIEYIYGGGTLIVLSRGGAFRTAVIRKSDRLARKPSNMVAQPLHEKLRIINCQPFRRNMEKIRPFDSPPNLGHSFHFQRSSRLPAGLSGLPRRIMMSPMLSAPFYPMTSSEGDGTMIYSLEDDSGSQFGPSLTILQRGRGHLVLIDHLIWDSKINGRPFSERILPVILHWALNIASS
jgi:hypothetical protein